MMTRRDREPGTRAGLRAGTAALAMLLGGSGASAAQQVTAPQPTVPEVFTLMGQYVRVAYNNQGFVTLGYRVAQQSVGEEWFLLEVGLTVRTGKSFTLKKEHLTLKTPDGRTLPLATQQEYAKAGYLTGLQMRAKVVRDSINYFPADVTRGCAVKFFANVGQGGPQLAFDEVELSKERACVGRLYFHVPGGIKVGQHWLHVNFGPGGEVQVPFRILTNEEQKEFAKSWEDIKKAHEAGLQ